MNRFLRITAFALALTAAGCSTPAASTGKPALLTSENAACHSQIENAVSASTGAPVTLDRRIFVNDTKLFIERAQPRDATGRLLDGRSLERPHVYRLVEADGKCVLADEQNAQRTKLPACECRVISP
jgi:hypothetical protein